MRHYFIFLSLMMLVFSCKEETLLTFEETKITRSNDATIDILYPTASGDKEIAKRINSTIQNYIVDELMLTEDSKKKMSLEEAVDNFDNEYKSFKKDFEEESTPWSANIEAVVDYESDELICIEINSYTDTGGAHGSDHVTFLNFNKENGQFLTKKALIKDMDGFKKLVKTYFDKKIQNIESSEDAENFFFGEDFQLPESIGLNEEGVVILYNTYELATYSQDIQEFLIPYDEAGKFLNYH